MAAVKVILLVLPVLADYVVVAANEGQRNITAEPGHDVTLPCRAGDGGNILAVEWTRPDLEPQYALLYRDGQLETDHEHPSFQQRVDLQDKQMKDGDVSLILKNVTTNDTGTYECRVVQRGPGKKLKDTKSIIHLEVSPSGRTQDGGDEEGGDEDGRKQDGDSRHPGLIVVLVVIVVLSVVMVGGVVAWIKRKEIQNLLCTKAGSQRVPSASDDQSDDERRRVVLL